MEIVQYQLNQNLGGIETYLRTLWSHIDRSRFRFSFIYSAESEEYPCFYEELKREGCNFYRITPRRVSVKRNREEVFELFETHRFDVLHFNSNTLSYIVPIEAAVKTGCRVIVHGHNSETARMMPRLLHMVNKRRLRNMDVNRIAVSSAAGKWFFGDKDFSICLNGIDTGRFRFSEKDRTAVRKEAGCSDKLVIGHVGTFSPAKNHRFIIEVFEKTVSLNEDAILWLIGDGDSSEIRSFVKEKGLVDQVVFWGKQTDLPRLYAGMDVFLFPSVFEGFGLVLLEAGCSGVPCLISDCIPDEVKVLKDYIYPYSLGESAEVWAKKLLEVAGFQKEDRTVSYLDIVKAGFSVEEEAKRMEEIYSHGK